MQMYTSSTLKTKKKTFLKNEKFVNFPCAPALTIQNRAYIKTVENIKTELILHIYL